MNKIMGNTDIPLCDCSTGIPACDCNTDILVCDSYNLAANTDKNVCATVNAADTDTDRNVCATIYEYKRSY